MIKGILFDVGGVLISIDGYDPYSRVAEFYNVDLEKAKKAFRKNIALLGIQYQGEDMEKQMWLSIAKELSSDTTEIPEHILGSDFTSRMQKNEKLLDILPKLKDQGLILGILSDVNPIHKAMLSEIYNNFDKQNVILSCDTGFRKYQKEAFEEALKAMNISANEILFVDDSEKNIEMAESLGFKTIKAENEEQIISELEKAIEFSKEEDSEPSKELGNTSESQGSNSEVL